jgi:hypothetical protein
MILMLAPAPDMSFSGMPSGSTYVSNQYGLITILSDAVADQTALQDAGCYTLSPFGGWGRYSFPTLADLYAADLGAILPGRTGFPSSRRARYLATMAIMEHGTKQVRTMARAIGRSARSCMTCWSKSTAITSRLCLPNSGQI